MSRNSAIGTRGRATGPRARRSGRRAGNASVETTEVPSPNEIAQGDDGASFDRPVRFFEFVGGIHLTDSVLWFDTDRKKDLCFLSHAHANFVGKSRRILATDKTLRILTRKSGKIDALTSPYKRSFGLGPLKLEMHPAGHVLGSAQLLVEHRDRRIVFTSDICTRRSVTVERAVPIPCDVLAIPATYGHPSYRFPPRAEALKSICKFIDECLNDNATPVLIANLIGTSQELIRLLGDRGYRMRVHGSIYEVAKVYRSLGVNLPGARRFGGTPGRDEVVIFPPILKKHAAIRKLKKSRTAFISGRASEPGFRQQQRVDAAFAFSDTADHGELTTFIEATGAEEVYLFGSPHVDEYAASLRKRGLRVYPLMEPKQLELL